MDIELTKEAIVKNVYHIKRDKKIPLHKHDKNDEIFYCLKGEGFGVLENEDINLSYGKVL